MPGIRALAPVRVALIACALALPAMAQETRTVPRTRTEITLSFAPVVRHTAPAVVSIYARKLVSDRASPFEGDPYFERFFRDMFPDGDRRSRQIENSLGSGVILGASGIVVSNHHVVGGAEEITVVLSDRREFEGTVIFTDEESDLAVLRLTGAKDLPTLELRDSDTLEVGDLVLAIGNPFGVGQTVTSGIISGLTRSGGAPGGGMGVFIQTDAAINPGNSGGALVDMEGRLVGINTAILSRSGGSVGIGFAVPANLVARVVDSARAGNTELVRPWLGLDGRPVTAGMATTLGLSTPQGILVENLYISGPLAVAGLRRGDVIAAIEGAPVNTVQELDFRAATRPIGDIAEVVYLRKGKERRARVRLIKAPERPARNLRRLGKSGPLPGLTVMNVNPAVIDELNLPVNSGGVLVAQSETVAHRIGLRQGDFIRKVNGRRVESVALLIKRLRTPGEIELSVERQGRTGFIRYER